MTNLMSDIHNVQTGNGSFDWETWRSLVTLVSSFNGEVGEKGWFERARETRKWGSGGDSEYGKILLWEFCSKVVWRSKGMWDHENIVFMKNIISIFICWWDRLTRKKESWCCRKKREDIASTKASSHGWQMPGLDQYIRVTSGSCQTDCLVLHQTSSVPERFCIYILEKLLPRLYCRTRFGNICFKQCKMLQWWQESISLGWKVRLFINVSSCFGFSWFWVSPGKNDNSICD